MPLPLSGGIYIIYLSDTHYYGGRTRCFKSRMRDHLGALRNGKHSNPHMQRVYNIHLRFEPQLIRGIEDPHERILSEQDWLDEHVGKLGCLNLEKCARGGIAHTPEAKARMSASHKGFKHSPETIEKMREARKKQVCGSRSAETLRRMSEGLKGKKRGTMSDEHKLKLSEAKKGRKHSAVACFNMSLAQLGKKPTPEQNRKNSESHKGKVRSPEHCHNIKLGWIKRRARAHKENKDE